MILFDEKYMLYQLAEKRASYDAREQELEYILSHKQYYEDRLQDITDELEFIEPHVNQAKYKERQQRLLQEAEHIIWCLLQYRRYMMVHESVISKTESDAIKEELLDKEPRPKRTSSRWLTIRTALVDILKGWDA